MAGHKLDEIDRKILSELQADGRMTNVELARRVGISAPPCLRRVRTLEESGYVRGYHADVNPRELGFEVQVFAMVGLHSQAESDLSAFEQRCREWPLVRECHMLNGEIDFILGVFTVESNNLIFIKNGFILLKVPDLFDQDLTGQKRGIQHNIFIQFYHGIFIFEIIFCQGGSGHSQILFPLFTYCQNAYSDICYRPGIGKWKQRIARSSIK